jgi:hypothetical protein
MERRIGMPSNDHIKHFVLDRIASGKPWQPSGRSKFLVNGIIVHVRYCSPSKTGSPLYKFNINPNTLTADYELWICGDVNNYYLIPRENIEQMYKDRDAYVDRHHEEIRVVSVNTENESATYARDGKSLDLKRYSKATV